MQYTISHVYIDEPGNLSILKHGDTKRVRFSSSGDFLIRHPGVLNISTYAYYYIHMLVDVTTSGPNGPQHTPRPKTQEVSLSVAVKIYSPDGLEFTAGNVTLEDLNRFRDLRSVSHGTWRYEAYGESDPIFVTDQDGSVTGGDSNIRIALDETPPPRAPAR